MIKEKLEKRLTFRMTKSEADRLESASKALGCKPSDALRLATTSFLIAASELSN
jgi:hypothetical protein